MDPERYALENLAIWLDVEVERICPLLSREQLRELYAALVVQPISPTERFLRRVLQPVMGSCPSGLRRALTGLLKQARNLNVNRYGRPKLAAPGSENGLQRDAGIFTEKISGSRHSPFSSPGAAKPALPLRFKGREPEGLRECPAARLFLELKELLGVDGIDWGGARSVVCLTHDVDNLEGYRFIEQVTAMEERYALRSSFNFLTGWEYQIHPELISQLGRAGYEVGLHGLTHDIALGFRSRQEIRRQITAAIGGLPTAAKGFRAPALAVSYDLLSVLNDLGFAYDSSLSVTSRYFRGVGICLPYRYPGLDLWEVPLAIQDDTLFRDLRLSDEEGFGVVKELVEQVRGLGGVAVINAHPCIIRKRPGFYRRLLEYLREQEDIQCIPVGALVRYLEGCKRIHVNPPCTAGGPSAGEP